MENIYLGLPKKNGFYKKSITDNDIFVECKFADSKQITANDYELQHDLFYRTRNKRVVVVKKGFVHNGASKGVLKNFGLYTNASILHDALYEIQHNRKDADVLFLEAMVVSKVVWWRSISYFLAVRVFGGIGWNNNTKDSVVFNKKFIEIFNVSKHV